jgi:dipeptidyl aminopeptidase/acylaminoacyl peptidase
MRHLSFLMILLASQTLTAQKPDAVILSRRIEYWNPAWSPDGRRLLFESTVDGKSSVYIINSDGTGFRRVTADTSESIQPNWSPDGRRIVFSSNRSGHTELYTMNVDGSGLVRLTTMNGGGWYQSSFSPNGKWIVFQGRPDNAGTRDRVFIVGADGSGLRQLTDSAYGAEGPRWSPDGRTIRFRQVPYPKRLWREMEETDMQAAKAAQRMVSIRLDGTGLTPLPASAPTPRPVASADIIPAEFEASPNGALLAYTKEVGGHAGLYVFDVASRTERLLSGGAAAGPIGYLRAASLTAATDTFDTYTSPKTGGDRTSDGSHFVRIVRRIGAARWEIADHWADSSGRVNTRQGVRTGDGSLATEIETVRADRDSASLVVAPTRVTAWVVPEGEAPRLFDGPPAGERYAGAVVVAAVGKSKPAIGSLFLAPVAALYGTSPLIPTIDTIRVVARDSLMRGTQVVPVLVLERNSGTRIWVDEMTGSQVAARGNAGPARWWWHIRRGIRFRIAGR